MIKNDAMLKKIRKILLVGSAYVALASMVLYGVLENTYVNYSRVPDEASGRVVPHDVKGITVYVTEYQSEMINCDTVLLIVSGTLTLVSLILNQKWPLSSKE
jgi:hypothetical protein